MTHDALLATCWTSAGDAASAAGFTGLGLLSDDLPAAVSEHALAGVRTMLSDNGIVDLELASIPYWWDVGAHREESDRVRRQLLEAAEVLHPRHLKVTPDGDNGPWDRAVWAERFAGPPPTRRTSARGWVSCSSPGPTSPR